MKNKLLLIIDPQVDFINGSLPVPGAAEAMDALAEYITRYGEIYSYIVVTGDRHPFGHCSFRSNGGQWPMHCVADSVGAAVWPKIMEALVPYAARTVILHKGEDPLTEEYSIFKNRASADRLLQIIREHNIDSIDICGLAGDICVADTIVDGRNLPEKLRFNVLADYTPSLDGGVRLGLLSADTGLPDE